LVYRKNPRELVIGASKRNAQERANSPGGGRGNRTSNTSDQDLRGGGTGKPHKGEKEQCQSLPRSKRGKAHAVTRCKKCSSHVWNSIGKVGEARGREKKGGGGWGENRFPDPRLDGW